jgi:hypothetical protein
VFHFHKYGLKITIEANKKIVNFLDVITLNLSTGKYQPYGKPNNIPLYVHTKSNHPPNILRNIPLSINKRLTEISSDEESFQRASQQYQQALQNSGYKHQLKYKHPLNHIQPLEPEIEDVISFGTIHRHTSKPGLGLEENPDSRKTRTRTRKKSGLVFTKTRT